MKDLIFIQEIGNDLIDKVGALITGDFERAAEPTEMLSHRKVATVMAVLSRVALTSAHLVA